MAIVGLGVDHEVLVHQAHKFAAQKGDAPEIKKSKYHSGLLSSLFNLLFLIYYELYLRFHVFKLFMVLIKLFIHNAFYQIVLKKWTVKMLVQPAR